MGADIHIDAGGATLTSRLVEVRPMRMGTVIWGCDGARHELPPGRVDLAGDGRAHVRRADIDEWFLNGPLGLEQGFDIRALPDLDCATLEIVAESSEGLLARVIDDGLAVELLDPEERARWRIDHVAAQDAHGRSLDTRFVETASGYSLRVDVRGADLPIEVDPLAFFLEDELTSPPGAYYFGLDVDLYEDTAVVGAYLSSIAGPSASGAAYVFRRVGGTWFLDSTLTAPDAAADDWFGWEVDIWGDTIVVGVMKDDTGRGIDRGSVRVFRDVGGTWSQEAVLEATTGTLLADVAPPSARDTIVAGPYGGGRHEHGRGPCSRAPARLVAAGRHSPVPHPPISRRAQGRDLEADTIAVRRHDGGRSRGARMRAQCMSSDARVRSGRSERACGMGGDARCLVRRFDVAVGARVRWSHRSPDARTTSHPDPSAFFENPGTGYAEVARIHPGARTRLRCSD
ncbi:MAG: FG-GAP repeat protein [Sandaracinaceae bacterium]